jgi:hypothetical protein
MTAAPATPDPGLDPFAAARAVADAVLYEGYVLYPYRASSAKNRTRWQWGVLMPPAFVAVDTSERSACRSEVLLEAGPDARLNVEVRFLHVIRRTGGGLPDWDETVERRLEVSVPVAQVQQSGVHCHEVEFPAQDYLAEGARRRSEAVTGRVELTLQELPGPYGALRLGIEVCNRSEAEALARPGLSRDEALAGALIAAHTLVAVDSGRFLSPIDPPEWATHLVTECTQDGSWPVLAGPHTATDSVVLCSPIILSDHPQIAPESPGDLYDACEIDEILTLRTMTLTDAEKAEARATDSRAAAVIDHVDNLPPELLDRLHGTVRYLRQVTGDGTGVAPGGRAAEEELPTFMTPQVPWWDPGADASVNPETDAVQIDGVSVARGSRVRLFPGGAGARRTDAQDLFLRGRVATVECVMFDVDGGRHLGVTLDDDVELAEISRMHGRYLYFDPDELEPVGAP